MKATMYVVGLGNAASMQGVKQKILLIVYLLVGGSRLSYILTVPSAQPATSRERSAVSRARLLTMVSTPAGISYTIKQVERCDIFSTREHTDPQTTTVLLKRFFIASTVSKSVIWK